MWLSYFWISKYIEGPYVAKAPTPFVYSCFLCLRLHLNIRMIAYKDTKFQRLDEYFLLNTMATLLDPNFAHR